MQLGAHIACARYIIEQALAVCDFFTNWLFSRKICRVAWMEDLNNILKYFLSAASPFKASTSLETHRLMISLGLPWRRTWRKCRTETRSASVLAIEQVCKRWRGSLRLFAPSQPSQAAHRELPITFLCRTRLRTPLPEIMTVRQRLWRPLSLIKKSITSTHVNHPVFLKKYERELSSIHVLLVSSGTTSTKRW